MQPSSHTGRAAIEKPRPRLKVLRLRPACAQPSSMCSARAVRQTYPVHGKAVKQVKWSSSSKRLQASTPLLLEWISLLIPHESLEGRPLPFPFMSEGRPHSLVLDTSSPQVPELISSAMKIIPLATLEPRIFPLPRVESSFRFPSTLSHHFVPLLVRRAIVLSCPTRLSLSYHRW